MTNDTPQQPNVVVFFTDQQRWDTTGLGGCPLDSSHKTLAHYFREAGCQTRHIRKWHLADGIRNGPVRPELRGGYVRS